MESPVVYAVNRQTFHPTSSMPRSLIYRLYTTGGNIDALLDSGAEVTLISERTVSKRGIKTEPLEDPVDIVLADQSRHRAHYCVPALPLSRDTWKDEVRCVVAPSLTEPLFLGRDWLQKWNPVINWVTGELSLADAGSPWLPKGDVAGAGMHVDPPRERREMAPSAYRKLVRTASRRGIKEDPGALLVVVRAIAVADPPDSSASSPPSEVAALMAQFPRVF